MKNSPTMVGLKDALTQINLNTRIKLTLLLEEFLHTVNVIHFFAKDKNHKSKSTSLAAMFGKLKNIPKALTKSFEDLINSYKHFDSAINEIESQVFDEYLPFKIFSAYLSYTSKEKKILQEMNFTQTKLVSILDSFPRYYPSPKETNIRDATKIHFYIENISEDLLLLFNKFLSNRDIDKVPAFFFWDFTPEINFLKDENNFIINSDVFLPNRQISWIILAHEALHFLYNHYKSRKNEDNLFWKMKEYAYNWKTTLAIAFSKNNIRSSKLDPELYFIDVLIDAILVKIFSYKYAFPALLYLFALDEGSSLSFPKLDRVWLIRYKAILEHIETTLQNRKLNYISKLLKSFKNLFKTYTALQKQVGFPNITNLYLEEEIIYITTKELVKAFLKDERIKSKINKIKEIIEKNTKDIPYLKAYLLTLQEYYDLLDAGQENSKNYKEGRAFCRSLLETTLCNKISKDNLKDYFSKPVFKFQFYRVRYDINKKSIEELYEALIGEENILRNFVDAYCFGSYTFLYISKEEEYEKVGKYEKCGRDEENWENLAKIINGENINPPTLEKLTKCPEIYLMSKLKFFRQDYSLTLYEGNEEDLRNIINNSKNFIYLFVKYNVNVDKVNNFNDISKLFKVFENSIKESVDTIKTFHFISFEWYDYLTLIVIKPPDREIHLNDVILKLLKETVLINNKNNKGKENNKGKLERTETDIFIGLNVLDKVKVRIPHIHLRVKSEDLGTAKTDIIPALERNFKVGLRFGIRDLVVKEKDKQFFEDNFQNLLRRIYNQILLTEKFSDMQFIVEVET